MAKEKLKLSTILDSPILSRIVVGIGEASEITGVSARQIRYWESKGIISSSGPGGGANRKYDYPTIEKIVLIKDFLDQGFTLEAAARRLEERIQRLNGAIEKLTGGTSAGGSALPVRKDGRDYVYLGNASLKGTKKKFAIFSPLGEDGSELLAEKIE